MVAAPAVIAEGPGAEDSGAGASELRQGVHAFLAVNAPGGGPCAAGQSGAAATRGAAPLRVDRSGAADLCSEMGSVCAPRDRLMGAERQWLRAWRNSATQRPS